MRRQWSGKWPRSSYGSFSIPRDNAAVDVIELTLRTQKLLLLLYLFYGKGEYIVRSLKLCR